MPGRTLSLVAACWTGAVLILGCATPSTREAPMPMSSVHDVPDSIWTRLASRRIFFGHQSVGGNIMDGVAELARENPRLGLHVSGDERALAAGQAAFAHALIG